MDLRRWYDCCEDSIITFFSSLHGAVQWGQFTTKLSISFPVQTHRLESIIDIFEFPWGLVEFQTCGGENDRVQISKVTGHTDLCTTGVQWI